MYAEECKTTVALGADWGNRYIGIAPPLTADEAKALEHLEIISSGVQIDLIDRFEPPCSVLTVELDVRHNTRQLRTKQAQELAHIIAFALKLSRKCEVRELLVPVGMEGRYSSPFNPKPYRSNNC
ncbi:MAG TPA: hypothetical protein VMQ52_02100 [Candidatus Saccharimonadales bacterium]|jgi:hypothetical protein|nr:hypothetical protein [Candidatus Saccharimonadales bacterium]